MSSGRVIEVSAEHFENKLSGISVRLPVKLTLVNAWHSAKTPAPRLTVLGIVMAVSLVLVKAALPMLVRPSGRTIEVKEVDRNAADPMLTILFGRTRLVMAEQPSKMLFGSTISPSVKVTLTN